MFDKDAWIKRAINARFIVAKEDGSIYRLDGKDEASGRRRFVKIKVSTHKKSGRKYFNLFFECIKKSVLVNRVVAIALIPNPANLEEVNHINGNKADNSVSNLEWANRSTQEIHARQNNLKANRGSSNSNAKLTPEAVIYIRDHPEISISALAKLYKVGVATVKDVRDGNTWKHI